MTSLTVTGIITQNYCVTQNLTPCVANASNVSPCPPGQGQCAISRCGAGNLGYQGVCTTVDPFICPAIAGGAQANFIGPFGPKGQRLALAGMPSTQGPQVACTYNVNNFRTAADVDAWINQFGMGDPSNSNDPLNKVILPTFCAQTSTTCPTDPTTGNPMPMCANLSSIGEAGTICRRWASLRDNRDIVDSTKKTACLLNNTPDCACINRAQNKAYRIIKQGNPFKDGCWFIPCSNPDVFLIPSDDIVQPGDCPQTVCQVVNNIVAQSGGCVAPMTVSTAVIGGQTNDISCALGGDPGRIGFARGGNPANLRWWVIVLIIIVIVIVLIVIVSQRRG